MIHSLEVSNGPTHQIANEVLKCCEDFEDTYYVAGAKVSVDKLTYPSMKFVEAVILPRCEEDDDYYKKLSLTVHIFQKSKSDIKEFLESWISEEGLGLELIKHETADSFPDYHIVNAQFLVEPQSIEYDFGGLADSPFLNRVWNKHMDKIITEGVCYVHDKVPHSLRDSLRMHINVLANSTVPDYHPNSNEIVRDLVHPALYSYIRGVSKLNAECSVSSMNVTGDLDFWGRPYEDSKFQWLPSPFYISDEGKCSISEYINNLNRDVFPSLYTDLERLFEVFLPYFEEVWAYAKASELFQGEDNNGECNDLGADNFANVKFDKEKVIFKGCELQVIVKIVEYKLKVEESYEGVWHAEGMSHENIVMTGIYFLDRDKDIMGGDLRFKRAFTVAEREHIFWNIPQDRPMDVNNFADEGFCPLGKFPSEEGYILVFPNSHIHKISKLINTSKNKSSSRRIVVFFVVNPERKIISTVDVAPQQGIIPLDEAKSYRLELMAERKYNKDKLNVRNIELCEH